jgi:protein-arginine kinase activator protein McsA
MLAGSDFNQAIADFFDAIGMTGDSDDGKCGLCDFEFRIKAERKDFNQHLSDTILPKTMPSYPLEVGTHSILACHHCKQTLERMLIKQRLGPAPDWKTRLDDYHTWVIECDGYRNASMQTLYRQDDEITAEWLARRLRKLSSKMRAAT